MISTHLAAAAMSATLAVYGCLHFKNIEIESIQNAYTLQKTKDTLSSRTVQLAQTAAVSVALADARQRELGLRAAAANASAELNGLRNTITNRLRESAATPSACVDYSTACSAVLNSCAGEYTKMAVIADGHASDAETLTQAWPK